jgi:type II secretory pathway component GspD/PulD (secretin)
MLVLRSNPVKKRIWNAGLGGTVLLSESDAEKEVKSVFAGPLQDFRDAQQAYKAKDYETANYYAYNAYSDIADALYDKGSAYTHSVMYASAMVAYQAIKLAMASELVFPTDPETGKIAVKGTPEYKAFLQGIVKFGYLELAEDVLYLAKKAATAENDGVALKQVSDKYAAIAKERSNFKSAVSENSSTASFTDILEDSDIPKSVSGSDSKIVLLAGGAVGIALALLLAGRKRG